MRRLGRLLQQAAITVAADNAVTIAGLPSAAEIAGRPLDVVIECDTGRKRAGVETAREAVQLARAIQAQPRLSFAGFLFYPTEQSWPQTQRFFDEAIAGIRALGLAPRIVSTGGTPNLQHIGELKGATEHRAGTYIFNDRMMLACGSARPEDCALTVYSTVVSRAAPERGILDAGSKTLTADGGGLDDRRARRPGRRRSACRRAGEAQLTPGRLVSQRISLPKPSPLLRPSQSPK
jgi:D-serine deaminase-like pyridoxal phosphate-dependent protein